MTTDQNDKPSAWKKTKQLGVTLYRLPGLAVGFARFGSFLLGMAGKRALDDRKGRKR